MSHMLHADTQLPDLSELERIGTIIMLPSAAEAS